ncbi:MAG TPA: glycosyl hydrolase, partial [Caldilinea sp.]|nr:glycosyl hydrolase [Caldilinea sp.]
ISQDFALAAEMGTAWTRIELPWLKIEPNRGEYVWAPYDAVFARLRELGVKPLVLIHSIPEWASDPKDKGCGPITDWAAFEMFLNEAVDRYGDIATAWEFINEPDGFAPHPLGPTIGCWAPYPEQYAEQLARFYAFIKQRQPDGLVFFGGLAHDSWAKFDREFLANTLQSGAGPYFDGVSLHFYPINPVEFPTVADKVNKIRSILGRFLLWDKQIWITETSMWSNGPQGLEGQKNFVVQEQTRASCAGVDTLFWFAIRQEPFDPPLQRWLINRQHQPDQGYLTYKAYAEQLAGATCQGRASNLPADVEAYRFKNAQGKTLYILWSNSGAQSIAFPATVQARVLDRDGGNKKIVSAVNGGVTLEIGALAQYVWID